MKINQKFKNYTYTMSNAWFFFSYIIFKGKKLMQWLQSPLWPKGLMFEHFFELSFLSTNEMDENKLSLGKFLKLDAQEQLFWKEPCSPWTMFLVEQGFKLFLGEQLKPPFPSKIWLLPKAT